MLLVLQLCRGYQASITLYLTFNQAATLKEKEAALLLLS